MAGLARTLLPFSVSAFSRAPAPAFAPRSAIAPDRPITDAMRPRRYYPAIFISDVHLGTRGCKAELLLDFLQNTTCSTLYLVGDIVDGWQLRRRWFWPEIQERVLHEILKKADDGVRVVYVPGNHGEVFRSFCERQFAGIEVKREAVHETSGGRTLLVVHGDQLDGVIGSARWLAHLGDWAYTNALRLNGALHVVRRNLGLSYWSLSAYLKHKVKNAVSYICAFEEAVVREAKRRGFDGVVCGHIHHAQIRTIDGLVYLNTGDWVESCTALVEDKDGNLEIIRWAQSETVPLSLAEAMPGAALAAV
jgi:UDP-2,3-diacylglucosamine pyrophosphatase LpxH